MLLAVIMLLSVVVKAFSLKSTVPSLLKSTSPHKFHKCLFRHSLTVRMVYTASNGNNESINTRQLKAINVKISTENFSSRSVMVLEADESVQEQLVSKALNEGSVGVAEDPYGVVLWPAAVGVLRILLSKNLSGENVVELGCGVGLVSLGLALYGEQSSVLATDYNQLSLDIVRKSWDAQRGLCESSKLRTMSFDLNDFSSPLPGGSLYVIADVLYNPLLGRTIAQRISEAVRNGAKVILGDSPGRAGREYMIKELSTNYPHIKYEVSTLKVSVENGYRHELISNISNSENVVDITVFIFNNTGVT